MSQIKSWQFVGGPSSLPYRLYDTVRRKLNHRLAGYLAANALQGRRGTVLEAGSGSAFASSLLSRNYGRFSIALDIDIEALKEARRLDPNLPCIAGDLYHLPFKTGVFDVVWNSSTLEHLEYPGLALAEMRRVASDYVFVGVPYRWGPLGFQSWVRNTRLGVWVGHVFSRDDLIIKVQQACLEPVETTLYFFRFFVGVLARKR